MLVLNPKNRPPLFYTALKVASYLTLILPVIALVGLIILKANHSKFEIVKVKEEASRGIDISESDLMIIDRNIDSLRFRKDTDEIRFAETSSFQTKFFLQKNPKFEIEARLDNLMLIDNEETNKVYATLKKDKKISLIECQPDASRFKKIERKINGINYVFIVKPAQVRFHVAAT